jgi:hypothetical protein
MALPSVDCSGSVGEASLEAGEERQIGRAAGRSVAYAVRLSRRIAKSVI